MRPGQIVANLKPFSFAILHAAFSAFSLPKAYHSFLFVQSDSSLQESWLITKDRSCEEPSLHIHAKSEDVSTQFLTDGVLEHAMITFSHAFTSISAMDFCYRSWRPHLSSIGEEETASNWESSGEVEVILGSREALKWRKDEMGRSWWCKWWLKWEDLLLAPETC